MSAAASSLMLAQAPNEPVDVFRKRIAEVHLAWRWFNSTRIEAQSVVGNLKTDEIRNEFLLEVALIHHGRAEDSRKPAERATKYWLATWSSLRFLLNFFDQYPQVPLAFLDVLNDIKDRFVNLACLQLQEMFSCISQTERAEQRIARYRDWKDLASMLDVDVIARFKAEKEAAQFESSSDRLWQAKFKVRCDFIEDVSISLLQMCKAAQKVTVIPKRSEEISAEESWKLEELEGSLIHWRWFNDGLFWIEEETIKVTAEQQMIMATAMSYTVESDEFGSHTSEGMDPAAFEFDASWFPVSDDFEVPGFEAPELQATEPEPLVSEASSSKPIESEAIENSMVSHDALVSIMGCIGVGYNTRNNGPSVESPTDVEDADGSWGNNAICYCDWINKGDGCCSCWGVPPEAV